jgi:hypothetical protein
VYLAGQKIGKAMQREGGVVRNYSDSVRPKPRSRQLFVLARREMDEPIDTPAGSNDPASSNMLEQQVR